MGRLLPSPLPALVSLTVVGAARPPAAPAQQVARHAVSAPQPVLVQQAGTKSSGTAVALSFLLTGGGQFYNEEYLKGGIMLGVSGLFTAMMIDGVNEYNCDPGEGCMPWLLPVGATGAFLTKVWSMVDAGIGANSYNRRHGGGKPVAVRPALVPLGHGRLGLAVVSAGL